jgi:CRISPR-associated endonuclease Csn1
MEEKLIFGLDIGATSIGSAVALCDGNGELLFTHSFIFPEGVDRDTKGKEKSKNETRRNARQSRRKYFRKRLRKFLLLKILIEKGMFPKIPLQHLLTELHKVLLSDELKAFFSLNPYTCREKAISGKTLTLYELGRIFYQFSQRRGYKEDLQASGEENDKSKINIPDKKARGEGKKGIKDTKEGIENGLFNTLGSYLASLNSHEERLRNRYTTRQMYESEFEKICDAQGEFDEYKELLGKQSKFKQKLKEIIFFQRGLRSQKYLLGKCSFEKDKTRCPESTPVAELFTALSFINGLRLGGEPLENKQLFKALEFFISKDKPEIKTLKKYLKVGDNQQFNYKDTDKFGFCAGISILQKTFGNKLWREKYPYVSDKAWYVIPLYAGQTNFANLVKENIAFDTQKLQKLVEYAQENWGFGEERLEPLFEIGKIIEDVWHILFTVKDPEWLSNYAKQQWKLDQETTDKILKIRFKKDYLRLSQKAVRNILPYLAQGFVYSEATMLGGLRSGFGEKRWDSFSAESQKKITQEVQNIAGNIKEGKIADKVRELLKNHYQLSDDNLKRLYFHSEKIIKKLDKLGKPDDLRNPRVNQAMYEIRRVVNELIARFGKPDIIRIELARDLKNSKEMRDTKSFRMKENETRNDAAKKQLDEHGISFSVDNLKKVLLWEEAKRTCPYTGNPIGFNQLFDNEVHIEHIVPQSRLQGNAMNNLTIATNEVNSNKSNQTPFELYGSDKKLWEKIKKRAFDLLPYRKALHFANERHLNAEEFTNRQLNDTQYISKEAVKYLQTVCDKVQAVAGGTTAILREYWGLENMLVKP